MDTFHFPRSTLPPSLSWFLPQEVDLICMSGGFQLDLANKECWQEIGRRKKYRSEFLFPQLLPSWVTTEQLHLSAQVHSSCRAILVASAALSLASGHHALSLPLHVTWAGDMAPGHCTLPCGSQNPDRTSANTVIPRYTIPKLSWFPDTTLANAVFITTLRSRSRHCHQGCLRSHQASDGTTSAWLRSPCSESHRVILWVTSTIVSWKVAISPRISTSVSQNMLVCFCHLKQTNKNHT